MERPGFQDTRPADLDGAGGPDAWREFRVALPQERLALLRSVRDGSVPVILNAPDGAALTVSLWTVDPGQARLNFSADPGSPQLARVVDADEAVAVSYLESVKLQFDLHGFVLVRGLNSCALQCEMPHEMYRFQRRNAFRVRPRERHQPIASFRHPSWPDMALLLRVLDVSIGGCALWLPHDVPPLQAGTVLGEVHVELDADTRIAGQLSLLHVSGPGRGRPGAEGASSGGGARLGCEWTRLSNSDERVLQRWIDRTQQRHRLLTLG